MLNKRSLWPSYTMWFSIKSVNSNLQTGSEFQQLASSSPDCKNRGKNRVPYSSLQATIIRALKVPCQLALFYSNLSNNKITDIEEGTFEGASGVNELILTSNRLESVHYSMLKGLNGLRTLWVSHACMTQLNFRTMHPDAVKKIISRNDFILRSGHIGLCVPNQIWFAASGCFKWLCVCVFHVQDVEE